MINSSFDYYSLIGVCLLGAMSPGPSLFVILGIASQHGIKTGIISAWSHAFGIGVWATTSVLAWFILIEQAQGDLKYLVDLVTFIASLYLLYMGFKMLRSSSSNEEEKSSPSIQNQEHFGHQDQQIQLHHQKLIVANGKIKEGVSAGLFISLANPKIFVFFSAIYPQVLPQEHSSRFILLAISIPFLVDGLWYHMVTLFTHKVGILNLVRRYQKATTILSASIFLFISFRTIYTLSLTLF